MAIFGDLADMPIPEVLRMLGPRTGKLYLRPTPVKQYELHLHEGAIFCFKVAGFSVRDAAQLRRDVADLFRLRRGEFEFKPVPLGGLEREVDLSRQDLLGLTASLDLDADGPDADSSDVKAEAHTPDQETRFRLKPGAPAHLELPDNLRTFLWRAHELLSAGCNASELTAALNLHPSLVKLYLIRLRTLGQITPVRAYAADYGGHSAAPAAAPAPALPPVAEPVTSAHHPRAVPTQSAHTARPTPQKSLIRRLLSALSFGGK